VAVCFTPGGTAVVQTQSTEVHVALIEPAHAVRLVVDVVRYVFQVLQVRPLRTRQRDVQETVDIPDVTDITTNL